MNLTLEMLFLKSIKTLVIFDVIKIMYGCLIIMQIYDVIMF
jgi:hypothetical protein